MACCNITSPHSFAVCFILVRLKLAINSFTDSVGRFPCVNMGCIQCVVVDCIFKNPQSVNDGLALFDFSYNSKGFMVL